MDYNSFQGAIMSDKDNNKKYDVPISSSSGALDLELIEYLCDDVFPEFYINKDAFFNWQLEISDSISDYYCTLSEVIHQDLLFEIPVKQNISINNLQHLISRTLELNDTVYLTFKIMILEVISSILSVSYKTLMKVYDMHFLEFLIETFIQHNGYQQTGLRSLKKPSTTGSMIRMISVFSELGVGVKTIRKLLVPLFDKRVTDISRLNILELLDELFSKYPSHFNICLFDLRRPISLPFSRDIQASERLTLNSWFKINRSCSSSDEQCTLFVIASSSSSNPSSLKVHLINYEQFLIEIYDVTNTARTQLMFNHILKSEGKTDQGFIHFSLTYDNYGNLNLYVDGEHSESIPCPGLRKMLNNFDKIYLGDFENVKNDEHGDEFIIRSLTILGTDLPPEWICVLYHLGVGYEWNYNECDDKDIINLLNHLNPKSLITVGSKINDIRKSKKRENNDILKSGLPNLHISKSDSHYNISDKEIILHSLAVKNIKPDHVLFDLNQYDLSSLQGRKKVLLSHEAESIHTSLYATGGTLLLIKLIESGIKIESSVIRDTIIYKAIKILFTVTNNDWRLNKEFDNMNGFGILSILLTKYKDTANSSLQFNLETSFEDNESADTFVCNQNNLLHQILSHAGFDFSNPYESVIANSACYRSLVLNFELYADSPSFEGLLYHFQPLTSISKYRNFNISELSRMKTLKKLLQFMKSQSLMNAADSYVNFTQLESTLKCILKADPSAEAIKSFSTYIIYALFNEDCSSDIGVIALKTLANTMCDSGSSIKLLKKFSRSITIHWMLLLLQVKKSKDVIKCALRLITRLLKILGPSVSKKFFQINHGLDTLTHYMLEWWDDDEIISTIYVLAFNDDLTKNSVSDLVSASKREDLNQLFIPDFLIILNNMVLHSMNILSSIYGKSLGSNPNSPIRSGAKESVNTSLNVLHLINEYIESISTGFNNNRVLAQFYRSKDWLEGMFELMGHLKISLTWTDIELYSDFKASFERMTDVLANIFIASIDDGFFEIFEGLTEFTKKLSLDIIFPKIFEQVSNVMNVSTFSYKQTAFISDALHISIYYAEYFLRQNYYVSGNTLDSYISSVLALIESKQGDVNDRNQLRKHLGSILIMKILKFENDGYLGESLKEIAKLLLYRQMTITEEQTLGDGKLGDLIASLLGILVQLPPEKQISCSGYILNFLRSAYLMSQPRFPLIVAKLTSEFPELILDFFKDLLTKNDEDALSRLQRYPTLTRIFVQKYNSLKREYQSREYLYVTDMISVTLNNGGKLGYLNSVYIKSFERDCEQLKLQVIHGETLKYNRLAQDRQESIQFNVPFYNSMKFEIFRLMGEPEIRPQYVLDYIENYDSMRKRFVIEDQLAESEKLSYHISIPIKQVDSIQLLDLRSNEDFELTAERYDHDSSFSLAQEESILDPEGETYEVVNSMNDTLDSESTVAQEDKNLKVIKSLYLGDQIVALWNISHINGLVPVEGLMILGTGYLYLIENYFHCSDGNVIDVQDAPTELRDPYLQLINYQSKSILKNESVSHRNKNWSLDKLSSISKRQFLLRDIALEMFFSDGASILITCLSTKDRDSIYNKLSSMASGRGLDHDLIQALQLSSSLASNHTINNSTSYFTSKIASAFSQSSSSTLFLATKKWKRGQMSNFYYLMVINILAGRTFNDLTQYPVFPWVIADYESDTLDLTNPRTFRDLSKPMGAQTTERAKQFKERYEALDSLGDENSPPFHYGTHYSSAMIVSSYLIRVKPFVQSYLLLQGGKFDHANRLFNSVGKTWLSSSRVNTTDVRELIPEFYYLPEFLVNSNNFELGTLQNGKASHDVDLPPWAHGDPQIFIAKNREALESAYVSANLHSWIDLIFGSKQNGPEAIKSLNVFHHLSYNGAINLDNIKDEVERRAVIGMINNFGQTPVKVFNKPHPVKDVLNIPSSYMTSIDANKAPRIIFESKMKFPIVKLEYVNKNRRWIGRTHCITSGDDLTIRKAKPSHVSCGSLIINDITFLNVHSSNITSLLRFSSTMFLSGSQDGIINVWKCNLKPKISLHFISILRGSFAPIKDLIFSKSYKVAISLDEDGIAIMWDLSRLKFIRKIEPNGNDGRKALVAISDDTGNVGLIYKNQTSELLVIYTINGDLLCTQDLGDIGVSAFSFCSTNVPIIENQKQSIIINHTYWTNEFLALGTGKGIVLFELRNDPSWKFVETEYIPLNDSIKGDITAIHFTRYSETLPEEKLSRGSLSLIIGDSTGRVYRW